MENDNKEVPNCLWHQSGVNSEGEPFIQLLRGEEFICQMSTIQAREHALAILEAAEAADQDAFMRFFLVNTINVPDNIVGGILLQFREFRRTILGLETGQKVRPAAFKEDKPN